MHTEVSWALRACACAVLALHGTGGAAAFPLMPDISHYQHALTAATAARHRAAVLMGLC